MSELAALRVEPSADFLGRLRRRIERRRMAGEAVDFSLRILLQTWWVYLQGLMEGFAGKSGSDREHDR